MCLEIISFRFVVLAEISPLNVDITNSAAMQLRVQWSSVDIQELFCQDCWPLHFPGR